MSEYVDFAIIRTPVLILDRHSWVGSISKPFAKLGDSRSDHPGIARPWKAFAEVSRMHFHMFSRATTFFSRNRLQKPNQYESLTSAFIKLIEIQLNDTLITWTEMQTITASMPQLQVIEMGYNRLTALGGDKPPTSMNSSIHFINLDSNFLSDWVHICASMREYKSYVVPLISLSLSLYDIKFTARCLDFQLHRNYPLSEKSFRLPSWSEVSISIG